MGQSCWEFWSPGEVLLVENGGEGRRAQRQAGRNLLLETFEYLDPAMLEVLPFLASASLSQVFCDLQQEVQTGTPPQLISDTS